MWAKTAASVVFPTPPLPVTASLGNRLLPLHPYFKPRVVRSVVLNPVDPDPLDSRVTVGVGLEGDGGADSQLP